MKASEAKLFDFLKGDKQFIIPIYQRPYSWMRAQCEQLWADIERVAINSDVSSHFIGAVVYIKEDLYQASTIAQLLVIDGQQRLTTIMLLLQALRLHLDGDEDHVNDTLLCSYLFNSDTPQVRRNHLLNRLVLRHDDQETLVALLHRTPLPERPAKRLLDNFDFFHERIRAGLLTPDEIYLGLNKLMLVDVSLDRQHDNPQLIFESLNSTGLDLSQADLIRNYILMGQPVAQQEHLYQNYWRDLEVKFDHARSPDLFDRFIRDYLTVQSPSGTIPNINQVYANFKQQINGRSIAEVVEETYRFAQYYIRLTRPTDYESDLRLRQAVENLNQLKADVTYPLLLRLYDDEQAGRLNRSELLTLLELIESYVFRRSIVGIPTNSLNKTFATLKRYIRPRDYVGSLRQAFAQMQDYRRFPNDEEFRQHFQTRDVYSLRRSYYLLERLENWNRKEPIRIENGYTIEHILPQNEMLPTVWQEMLGPDWKLIQARWLHTIGNLTLTRYNSELSDHAFPVKRDHAGGFGHSPLWLNEGLGELTGWTEAEITRRAAKLADKAVIIWPWHGVQAELLTQPVPASSYRLEDQFPSIAPGGHLCDLFTTFYSDLVLSLDPAIRYKVKKRHVCFKREGRDTFIFLNVRQNHLYVRLGMPFNQLHDPRRMTNEYHRTAYPVPVFNVTPDSDFAYVRELLAQAYRYVNDEAAPE